MLYFQCDLKLKTAITLATDVQYVQVNCLLNNPKARIPEILMNTVLANFWTCMHRRTDVTIMKHDLVEVRNQPNFTDI
jgi:hypothetical protein